MATTMVLQKCRDALLRIHRQIGRIINSKIPPGGSPALAYDVAGPCSLTQLRTDQRQDPQSLLEAVFGSYLHMAAVPKRRRSYDKKWLRRFGPQKVMKFMTPKTNIVSCLECGNWHERHTICGHCYNKVKEETEAMKKEMDYETLYHNVPHSEVAYIYQGEDKSKHDGKFVVEVERPRPEWWSKNMLSKGHGKASSD